MSVHHEFVMMMGGVLGLLLFATMVGLVLRWRTTTDTGRTVVTNLNQRIRAWWVMVILLTVCFLAGEAVTLIFFAGVSLFALREFMSLVPTRRGDYLTLCVCFYLAIPLQYGLIWANWYGLFAILLPVYGFLLLPALGAVSGDTEHFLARCATVQWGLLLTVYCISYVPALLLLNINGYEGHGLMLILFLLIVVQLSDVLQYVFGKLLGRHLLAPKVSPSKTVEGLIGGGLSATLIGGLIHGITPFSFMGAMGMAALIVVCGFLGGLALSAIKRGLGTKDWGTLIEGHGGILDRLDSVCFAAPIFFHTVRYLYAG